jgi:hydroxymethylbilane synthase
MNKFFVSRSHQDWQHVIQHCSDLPIEWICQPLIRFESVPLVLPEQSFGWVFFSSSQAVHHFFLQKPKLDGIRFGALGLGTARALSNYGSVDFVGSSANLDEVAMHFVKVCGTERVLFPQAISSLRTIQRHLPAAQVLHVVCYATYASKVEVPACDHYLFSSPSNVQAYFEQHQLPPHAQLWSFGASTSRALRNHAAVPFIELAALDPVEIAGAIKQFFTR